MATTTERPATLARRVSESSRRRRQEQRADLSRRIHRAASDLLLEGGYEALSLRKVAARIGYTATTIYRHYRDKDELVASVVREGFESFEHALLEAEASASDPFEQLRAVGMAYVRFGIANPIPYRTLFLHRPELWERRAGDAPSGHDAALEVLTRVMERCIVTGDTRDRDVAVLALAAWATFHGVVSMTLALPVLAAVAAEEVAETAVRLHVEGLRAP
jgi:AcrR family transcriptional regulator